MTNSLKKQRVPILMVSATFSPLHLLYVPLLNPLISFIVVSVTQVTDKVRCFSHSKSIQSESSVLSIGQTWRISFYDVLVKELSPFNSSLWWLGWDLSRVPSISELLKAKSAPKRKGSLGLKAWSARRSAGFMKVKRTILKKIKNICTHII